MLLLARKKGSSLTFETSDGPIFIKLLEGSARLGIECPDTVDVLRDDAKQYERKRTAYMMARLKAGRHPDTDPKFWSEWKEPPVPVLRDWKTALFYPYGPWAIGITLWVAAMVWAVRRSNKKRSAAVDPGA